MADEQYRWLDRETAERLLRGESLEAVDATARDQAERLAKTLGALSVDTVRDGAELPGEAAALAAFRTARDSAEADRAALGGRTRVRSSDAGLVRIGSPVPVGRRSPWGGPVRLALTAVLAVGMVGGVAVAAGTGVLPSPFREDPAPGTSISAAATPDGPPGPSAPDGTATADPGSSAAAGGRTADPPAGGSADGSAGTGRDPGSTAGTGKPGGAGWWKNLASSCRDLRDGTSLDAGRRRTLEGAAGGSSRVGTYCAGVLRRVGGSGSPGPAGSGSGSHGTGPSGQTGQNGENGQTGQGDQTGQGGEQGIGQEKPNNQNNQNNQSDQGGHGGQSGSGDDGGHWSPGRGGAHANGTAATPEPSAFTPLIPGNTAALPGRTDSAAVSSPSPSPSPSPSSPSSPSPGRTYRPL